MVHEETPKPSLPSPVGEEEGSLLSNELLTPEEACALVRAASGRAPTGQRNRALVAVMYRSGLRPGEALALLPADVDLEGGMISVPARKGGSPRLSGLDLVTREMIGTWLARRVERGIGPGRPLFCTLAGEPLKAAYVRELLPRLARRAGIRKRVHPLALRYANAAELAEEGMPTSMIDRHLGVAAIGAARRYQRSASAPDVVAVVAARVWRF
jgi:integrase/recombinase XerD